MIYTKFLTTSFAAAALLSAPAAFADTIFFEDFEDDTVVYTTSVPDDLSDVSNRDYYGRVAAADLPGTVEFDGIKGSSFYAVQDTDGATNPVDEITLEINAIDVSAFSNLNLSFLLAEDDSSDGAEDWDFNTSLIFAYQIDGGGFIDAFAIEALEPGGDGVNNPAAVDTDLDGIGDGTVLTDSFSLFDFDIASGSVLDLRLTFLEFNAGDEDIALDNLALTGDKDVGVAPVPLPAGIWLLGLALGGLGLARRKA